MKKDNKTGLSTIEIAGIITGVFVFLCIALFFIYIFYKKVKRSRPSSAEVSPNFSKT